MKPFNGPYIHLTKVQNSVFFVKRRGNGMTPVHQKFSNDQHVYVQDREGAVSLTAQVTSGLEQGGVREAWAFSSAADVCIDPTVVFFSILPASHAAVVGSGWFQSNLISLAGLRLKSLHNAWKSFRENRTSFLTVLRCRRLRVQVSRCPVG